MPRNFLRPRLPLAALACLTLLLPAGALAAPGMVVDEAKVADATGGFSGVLADGDRFGSAVAPLGDLDGDGVGDVALGALFDDDGGTDRGAVWVLFLAADGTVQDQQKISDTAGGFTGVLADGDNFGASLAPLGDLDGDGLPELAVGAPTADGGGTDRGAVWVLSLKSDGTVDGQLEIGDSAGGFAGTLANEDLFGSSVARLDDLDGDGVDDLAVGAIGDGLVTEGAVWVLFMNGDGTVKGDQKINGSDGGFDGSLGFLDQFGWSLASLDDLDGDGVDDLAVGLGADAIWILFLDSDGTVLAEQKISDSEGGFDGAPGNLGWALSLMDDVDGDGVRDLAAGAASDDDGGTNRGALWVLFMASDGTVKGEQKISASEGGFIGPLADGDELGFSLAYLGDAGGPVDLVVGAYKDDTGGSDRGAAWLLDIERSTQAVPALQGPALFALVAGLGAVGGRFASRRRRESSASLR